MPKARELHAYLIKTGLHADPLSLRRLLQHAVAAAYNAPDALPYSRTVFSLIPNPDALAYNTIIKAHSHSSYDYALSLFSQMRLSGVVPDHFTFPLILRSYARLGEGRHIHSLVVKLGFDSLIYVRNALINVYGSSGSVKLALKLFDEMPRRDLVSWSTIIVCFVNNGLWDEALDLFRQMQIDGDVMPDEILMLSVISAVSSSGSLELGKWVDGYITRVGLNLTVALGTVLIDMYSRCGSVDDSIVVFDQMPQRNIATWTALINGLGVHGRGKEALRVFSMMKKAGLQPDHITFRAVLVGCSHGGLVDDGWKVFNSIKNEYGMEPRLQHYGCMIDLLSRVGLLCQAFKLAEKMPIKPNEIIWRTLLGACVNHNRLDLAEKAKENIYKLELGHNGDYVLLSNAYGGAGRWVDKELVRNSMMEKRISKVPGCSFLSIDQVIHEFVSGDYTHPESREIKEFIVSTIEKLRLEGYTPLTSNSLHDIEEEEKEHSVNYHSEKLAVAFSLIRNKNRKKIRIMKNLRICTDCHCFMKHVSHFFSVEIVVRDRNRFHHFRDGICSCRDYW